MGAIVGLYVYNLALARVAPQVNFLNKILIKQGALYGLIAGGAVVFGIITFFFERPLMVFSTGIAGAYLAIRGVSFAAKGFPSEFDLYQRIKEGGEDNWKIYIYLAAMAVLGILGIIIQCKFTMRAEKDKDDTTDTYAYKRQP